MNLVEEGMRMRWKIEERGEGGRGGFINVKHSIK